jgi:hypothetical protein
MPLCWVSLLRIRLARKKLLPDKRSSLFRRNVGGGKKIKKTLRQAVASGIGTLGKIAGATLATAAAVKPLIILGLGKCE